jgi:hypothetical protein
MTVSLLLMLAAGSAMAAAQVNCQSSAGNVEEFRYSWRLRGGIRFLAGLVFPTAGVANLRTSFPTGNVHSIHSELLITAPTGKQGGFFAYESEMDDSAKRTLMTYHGYAWGDKARNERTNFDYAKGLARMHREKSDDDPEYRVKKLPSDHDEVRDILTAIYFLRQNATTIAGPVQTSIYSDGKEYPVIFRPIADRRTFVIEGKTVASTGFEIVDAPGGKKWPGGVKVWLSADERRIPFRIEIQQSVATMQLDLQSVEACAFMMAAR